MIEIKAYQVEDGRKFFCPHEAAVYEKELYSSKSIGDLVENCYMGDEPDDTIELLERCSQNIYEILKEKYEDNTKEGK
jgi:hypothetical protein